MDVLHVKTKILSFVWSMGVLYIHFSWEHATKIQLVQFNRVNFIKILLKRMSLILSNYKVIYVNLCMQKLVVHSGRISYT